MPSFGAESFVFKFPVQKFKDYDVQNYKCACCFVWVCENWSLTLREERRLRVFENRVLRRTFGAKKDEVLRKWGKTT